MEIQMCLYYETECNIPSMTGYVLMFKERDDKGETYYRSLFRTKYTSYINEKQSAVMYGSTVGGFHAFKTLQSARQEKTHWMDTSSIVIIECLMEDVFSEGMFTLLPAKTKRTVANTIKAKHRTIVKEIVKEKKKGKDENEKANP